MGLPLRDICDHELLSYDNTIVPWASTAEISRFAVSKRLRQRATDRSEAGGEFPLDYDPRRRIPDTSLGLMQGVIAMAATSGVTHLCAAMEPALLRMLRRLGMQIPSLGPEVEYHGRRQPCYSHIDTALAKIWLVRRDVWELLTRDGALWPLNTDLTSWLRRRGDYVPGNLVAAEA
jgi:N-acyl amino acid synthase of PEP-CTERM/exosortase system